jgi:hypothetical protein
MIARMRSQNSGVSRYFASRLDGGEPAERVATKWVGSKLGSVEKSHDGFFQQAVSLGLSLFELRGDESA